VSKRRWGTLAVALALAVASIAAGAPRAPNAATGNGRAYAHRASERRRRALLGVTS
jgi:hypothetical protein